MLPRGGLLDPRTWQVRHRILLVLLVAHVPALLLVGRATGQPPAMLTAEVGAVVALAAIGALAARRRLLACIAVTTGLMTCSAILVDLTGGLIPANVHFFVMLGFIALYQDWRPYLLAVGFVVLTHGVIGVLAPQAVYGDAVTGSSPWAWAALHAAFVVIACAGQIAFWRTSEREQARSREHYRELYEGERAVAERLRQAEQLKSQLIAVVSHEFRTPLTSILGFAQTLSARISDLEQDTALVCADQIERQARRLARVVSNLMAASCDAPADRGAVADLAAATAAAVGEIAGIVHGASRRVDVAIPPGTEALIGHDAARQVVGNLVDNALKFADAGSSVRVSARRTADAVVFEVADVGTPIAAEDRARIFDAFVQADSSDTRRHGGIGLGLHIVRKLVTAHGGTVDVEADGPRVVFRVTLGVAPHRAVRIAADPLAGRVPHVHHATLA